MADPKALPAVKETFAGWTVVITGGSGKSGIACSESSSRYFTRKYADALTFAKELRKALKTCTVRVRRATVTVEVCDDER